MLKTINTVSLHDDKRFALNLFLKILSQPKFSIKAYFTQEGIGFNHNSNINLNCAGVYIIYLGNEIIYIGQSTTNVYIRIVRFLKGALDRSALTESHSGGEKYREYMKWSYDNSNIMYEEKFDEWLINQPLSVSVCPIDEHFCVNNHEGEYAYPTKLQRPYLDEFLAGAMKKRPKFNSKVQTLNDHQLIDCPSKITTDKIAEELDSVIYQMRENSNIENFVMEKKDMTTIFEDLTEQDHAWLDGLSNRANLGFRNIVLDKVLSLDADEGFKFPTVSKSGFTQGSWVRKKALESNPNIALTFKKKENYCYVKRTA